MMVNVTQADRDLLDEIWLAAIRHQPPGPPADDVILKLLAAHRIAAEQARPSPAGDVVERVANGVLHDKVHAEAHGRYMEDATHHSFDHHLVVVAAEHGARAALSAMPADDRASIVAFLRDQGMSLPDTHTACTTKLADAIASHADRKEAR